MLLQPSDKRMFIVSTVPPATPATFRKNIHKYAQKITKNLGDEFQLGVEKMQVEILGVIPLSAVKRFGTFEIQYLDLFLVTDTSILILKDVCRLKGLEEVFPISRERLKELFKQLPKSSKEFRKYIHSITGSNFNLDMLAKKLGRKFSNCIVIPYGDITRLGIKKRRVHMIFVKTNIIEVMVDTKKKSYRFTVLPGSYKDVTEDVAYAEVLDMLRKSGLPIDVNF